MLQVTMTNNGEELSATTVCEAKDFMTVLTNLFEAWGTAQIRRMNDEIEKAKVNAEVEIREKLVDELKDECRAQLRDELADELRDDQEFCEQIGEDYLKEKVCSDTDYRNWDDLVYNLENMKEAFYEIARLADDYS